MHSRCQFPAVALFGFGGGTGPLHGVSAGVAVRRTTILGHCGHNPRRKETRTATFRKDTPGEVAVVEFLSLLLFENSAWARCLKENSQKLSGEISCEVASLQETVVRERYPIHIEREIQ